MSLDSVWTTIDCGGRKIRPGFLAVILVIAAIGAAPAAEDAVSPLAQSSSAQKEIASRSGPFPNGRFTLDRGDVVAFLGGADVAAAQHAGHLETLLAVKYHGLDVRFRNFGWEGDTVFAQPRDVGFPSLTAHLQRARASVIILQFGRSEALSGRDALPGFISAYQKLLEECARQTPRLLLVTPPPFEKAASPLPDLSVRNADLAAYSSAIRDLARQRNLPLVDLFTELSDRSNRRPPLTDNGLQMTLRGHALVAVAFARQLGFAEIAERAGKPDENGAWPNIAFERVRQAVTAKNRLWFNYWRPQNWAFLGGDRTSQPSSRDHRNPNVRWFPEEMEKYVPLIEAKEREIAELANQLR